MWCWGSNLIQEHARQLPCYYTISVNWTTAFQSLCTCPLALVHGQADENLWFGALVTCLKAHCQHVTEPEFKVELLHRNYKLHRKWLAITISGFPFNVRPLIWSPACTLDQEGRQYVCQLHLRLLLLKEKSNSTARVKNENSWTREILG